MVDGVSDIAAGVALLGAFGLWATGKTVQNNMTNPPGQQHQDAGQGSQSLPAAPADTASQCCPPPDDQKDPKRENKKNHIFGKSEHNLDGLLILLSHERECVLSVCRFDKLTIRFLDADVTMDHDLAGSEARFASYVEALSGALGHADRVEPLKHYCTGLLLPGERKSVEPMAAIVAPARVAAEHQSLLHLVGQAAWSDAAVLQTVRDLVLPAMERQGPIEAWIVDDTGFAKKGVHSVGVARQYCGRLGKQDNCQIAVSLSVAHSHASLPIAYRLYLPEEWAGDPIRRAKAKVPEDVVFQTKPEIALDQIAAARAAGVTPGVVLADAAYGGNGAFRAGITALGLAYAVGIQSHTTVWPPGLAPLPPKPWSGRGRPPSLLRRDADHAPVSVKDLALSLPAARWTPCTWREGTNTSLSSRFCALRVRAAGRDWNRTTPHPVEWLLIEWPEGAAEPDHYSLSTVEAQTDLASLVEITKQRWRIERDYEELKSELGLAHYEGRGWRGFHHHATLCIAAYGFLIRERAAVPPSASGLGKAPRLSAGPRPRGAPDPARTPRHELHYDLAEEDRRRPRKDLETMSMLSRNQKAAMGSFMTQ